MAEPKLKIIAGQEFTIAQPYDEGHPITAAEAKALNQTRSENIGNNCRRAVEEALEAAEAGDRTLLDDLPALVAKYDSEYVFTLANVGGGARKLDPEEREAFALAKEAIKQHLAKTGRKINVAPDGFDDDAWADKIQGEVERIAALEDTRAEAKKRVAAKKKASDKIGANVDF